MKRLIDLMVENNLVHGVTPICLSMLKKAKKE